MTIVATPGPAPASSSPRDVHGPGWVATIARAWARRRGFRRRRPRRDGRTCPGGPTGCPRYVAGSSLLRPSAPAAETRADAVPSTARAWLRRPPWMPRPTGLARPKVPSSTPSSAITSIPSASPWWATVAGQRREPI